MAKSDLPFGSEFSPSQLDLPILLQLIKDNEGSITVLQTVIRNTFFHAHKTSDKNKTILAMNCKLGLIAYGVIDRQGNLTALGAELYAKKDKEKALYEALAKYILLKLSGMILIGCIQDMTITGEVVTLTTLRDGLAARDIHYPSGGKHPSIMRLWLAKAGVFIGSRWQVDEMRIKEIIGIKSDEFEVLAGFTTEQRAFIKALVNTGVRTPQYANEIARLASTTYGIKFPEKNLPKLVLHALMDAGYISAEKTTAGRGAKPFLVAPTDKLIGEIIEPLLEQLAKQIDPKLRFLLKKPISEILEELDSSNRHIAGLALEALGFKLMQLLDMYYLTTRLRGNSTGGAEVDIIFESTRLVYSRWQVQCKNTAKVSLDDVAKEVGLTHFLKSSAIVIITTGQVGAEARRYANKIMADSNLAIVMIDGDDIGKINNKASAIIDIFEREAKHAMKLKSLDIEK